jgi:hypothetical protein
MISGQRSQQGIILVGLMLVLAIATGVTLLQRANRSNATALERDAKTMAALLAARDALIARAVLDADRPGSLPCPDLLTNIPGNNIPGDGKADLLAGVDCPAYAGWLPWRTLDLNEPTDASGTALWYVLSPAFRDSNLAINSATMATLTVDGQAGIVALIIAPGGAHGGQIRPSNNIADYLDDLNGNPATSNRDGDTHYFSGPPDNTFNDRMIAITKTAWQDAVAKRVLGEIRYAIATVGGPLPKADIDGYGQPDSSADIGAFPYKFGAYDSTASTTWQGEAWHKSLEQNGWFPLVTYDRLTRTLSLDGHTVTLP